MKKWLVLVFFVLLTGTIACYFSINSNSKNSNLYNFLECTSSEIENVKKLDLGENFDSVCETYKFTYFVGKVKVKGYISIPIRCIKEQKAEKCILFNRGGNFEVGLLSDDTTAYLCKATNRIVIASQYRGCDGSNGKDEFGGEDIGDIIKLVDFLENAPLADMEDFCTIGISRGGMMSYILAKNDERIKKVVAISAISDLIECCNMSESKVKDLCENCIGVSFEELPEEYKNRSAIFWYDKITVPTLIIHSKNDKVVPYNQADEFYKKLKSNGTNCELITYDDSVHGFHNEDLNAIVNWLNN